jgi:hypothetical protein
MKNLGYLIVPLEVIPYVRETNIKGYRGIDRQPFTSSEIKPLLPEEEQKENSLERALLAAEMEKCENEGEVITSLKDARRLLKAVRKIFDTPVELIECCPLDEEETQKNEQSEWTLLGFDVACLSSDFFSAIRHGLLGHMETRFLDLRLSLNRNLLFPANKMAFSFLKQYTAQPDSEKDVEFFVIAISRDENGDQF